MTINSEPIVGELRQRWKEYRSATSADVVPGVQTIDMPATPGKIWRACRGGG